MSHPTAFPYRRFPAALFATSLVLTACHRQETPVPAARPALAYKVPETGTANTDVDIYAGEIRARVESDHAFRVGGKIARRLVDMGATIKRGQALALLDPQDIKLAAEAARAQVAAQTAETEFAEAELKRFRDLFAKGFISQSALDQRINAAQASRARLDALKASAAVSLNQAAYATLAADSDGVVTQVFAEAGQVVAAGQPVMRVADPRERELAIAVSEAKIGEFRGARGKRPIHVHLWSNPDRIYAGSLREVAAAADPTTRTYAVRVSLDAKNLDAGVALGMSAYGAFVGAIDAALLSVPLSAIYAKGNDAGVWLIGADGKVSLRPVAVVQYRETTALVRAAGLKPGDVIVAAGVHKLRDGEIVKPVFDREVKGDGKIARSPDDAPSRGLAASSAAAGPPALR